MPPRITIVTPSFQQAAYVEECITSVLDQGYPDLEYMVIDGGSTDGSRAIGERYADRLTWWCSEKDKGQAHAINKGLERATGRIFGWINSDDLLLPGSLEYVGNAFANDPELVVLTGVRRSLQPDHSAVAMPLDDPDDPDRLFTGPLINQQSTFFRMDAIREAGLLEAKLQCVMDYELWLQVLFRRGTTGVRIVPWELAVFRAHPNSKTATMASRFLDEQASIVHGLCLSTGEQALADVLAIGHAIKRDLRAMPVGPEKARLVRDMVERFLLKWHHTIYSGSDLRMMRSFRRVIPNIASEDPMIRKWVTALDDQLRATSWFSFRLRRKWKHLFG